MTYDFSCTKCAFEREVDFPGFVPEGYQPAPCKKCGSPMQRLMSTSFQINAAPIDDRGWEGYNTGLGEVVTSRRQAMDRIKAKGLVWLGDEGRKDQLEFRKQNIEVGRVNREKKAKMDKALSENFGPKYTRNPEAFRMRYGEPIIGPTGKPLVNRDPNSLDLAQRYPGLNVKIEQINNKPTVNITV